MQNSDHVALVTGASGGLGTVMSEALVKMGLRVVLAGTSLERATALGAKLGSEKCHALAADLENPDAVQALAAKAAAAFGRIDILVNNAAFSTTSLAHSQPNRHVPLLEVPDSFMEQIYRVNVLAPLRLTRALLPPMLDRKWGRIINISTGLGTMLAYSGYGGSKAALEAETASLAAQLEGTGVTANMLLPGGAAVSAMTRGFPSETLLQPGIMASPVCYLASDASRGINGRRIRARFWDGSLPSEEAARIVEPIAWASLAESAGKPPHSA
jgi:NAD(P)-dependent dehydrogenase (short-subunit alcohol dehydrogenase family)